MRKKKGFTLVELIVVIAIFGILIAVITPAWARYLQRSRYRAQNQKAKAVFNAAQTIIIDLDFAERRYFTVYDNDVAQRASIKKYLYTPTDHSDWYYYWNGRTGFQCDASGNAVTADANNVAFDTWNNRIGDSIQRIAGDDVVYKIWVKDYKVQAVATANMVRDRYIGAHPTTIFDLERAGNDTDALRNTNARAVDLTWFDLDLSNNP